MRVDQELWELCWRGEFCRTKTAACPATVYHIANIETNLKTFQSRLPEDSSLLIDLLTPHWLSVLDYLDGCLEFFQRCPVLDDDHMELAGGDEIDGALLVVMSNSEEHLRSCLSFLSSLLTQAVVMRPFNSTDRLCALSHHPSESVVMAATHVLHVVATFKADGHLLFTDMFGDPSKNPTNELAAMAETFHTALSMCFPPEGAILKFHRFLMIVFAISRFFVKDGFGICFLTF